mgnify:CR=1 FL=1
MACESPATQDPGNSPQPLWSVAPGGIEIGPGDLHLWRIRTPGAAQSPWGSDLEACLALLDTGQRERAGRLRLPEHRARWVRAQAGLRRILARYLRVSAHSLGFLRGPAGKPYLGPAQGLAGGTELTFNLTTTGDLALVALSAGDPIGVDCEWVKPRSDLIGVARRMFTAAEVDRLEALADGPRLSAFYRAWTRLEADAKWDGRGLFRPRSEGMAPPEAANFSPESGYMAAVARGSLPPVEQWRCFDLDGVDPG